MSSFATLAVAGLGVASSVAANSAAGKRADAANAANSESAERSRLAAQKNTEERRAELLRRFNIKSSKVADSADNINRATAVKLTSIDLAASKAMSTTDNVAATRHITGRLASRMKNALNIHEDMQKGTTLQEGEQANREIGAKLEAMGMDYESETLNLDIDLTNALNAANNAEVRGYTYSQSTGALGVINAGVSGIASGMSMGASFNAAFPSTPTTT